MFSCLFFWVLLGLIISIKTTTNISLPFIQLSNEIQQRSFLQNGVLIRLPLNAVEQQV